jgi:hypothetical protein
MKLAGKMIATLVAEGVEDLEYHKRPVSPYDMYRFQRRLCKVIDRTPGVGTC